MIAAEQVQLALAHWHRSLPPEVAMPDPVAPITRIALVRVIRAELLEFITFGPSCDSEVAENFRQALEMYCRGWGPGFTYWLGKALRSAVRARARVAEPFDPTADFVPATAWGVSYEIGSDIKGVRLYVHDLDETAPNALGGTGVFVCHPLYDGLSFSCVTAATKFAYKAGLLKRYASRHTDAAQAQAYPLAATG